MPKSRAVALIAAIALLITGCGGGDGDDSGQQTSSFQETANTDVTSGCWTATDRKLTGGNGDMTHQKWNKAPEVVIDDSKTYQARMETSKGQFTIDLLPTEAPVAVNNFVCLARAGYFDGTPFHRIISGFVIQGGDPTGTGTGGPGYRFNDEPISKDYVKGTVAMANAGPNTNGSQFFVVLDDLRGKLGKNYTIFGEVSAGMDIVDAIGGVDTKRGPSGEKSAPTEPVILEKVTISDS
jgi:cyclophilin family peptidyl-prolyl cis-trans isomerase